MDAASSGRFTPRDSPGLDARLQTIAEANVEPALWTHNGNVVPMCWDEWLDIQSGATLQIAPREIEALKVYITDTIEGTISFLKRCFGWDRCAWRSYGSFRAYTGAR